MNRRVDKKAIKSIPFSKYVFINLLVNFALIGFVLIIQKNLPPEIPLLYGKPIGLDRLAPSIFLIIPPLISVAAIIINSTLAILANDKFVQKVLIALSFAVTALSTITLIKIIFLVGSF